MSELKPIISLWYGRSQDEGAYTAHMTVSGLSSDSQAQAAVNYMRTQFAGEELVHQDGPCAQPAQAVPLLSDVELAALMPPPDIDGSKARSPNAVRLAMRAAEQAVRAKMGKESA